MAIIAGLDRVSKRIANLTRQYVGRKFIPRVVMGYTAAYAVYVHEDLTAVHPVGQAKFLEEPARTKRREIVAEVEGGLRRGFTLEEALLLGGLRLQRESQVLVPVDTGNLKGSAFTRAE